MDLLRLKLTNFKNYETLDLPLSARLNCFVGLNGVGKTNLLDAIHYICLCKSNAGLPDKNLLRHGETFFRVEAHFEKEGQKAKVVAKFQPPQKKEFECNGSVYPRLSDHIGHFPVVMIAPDDVSLLQEGSEERRRFLDATLSQIFPEYLSNLFIYNSLLKQRNAVLKQFAEEKRFDAVLLDALDQQMPGPAQQIFEKRRDFCAEFLPVFAALYANISGKNERADLRYESDLEKNDLLTLLQTAREKDRFLQRTSVGPHRDDIWMGLDEQPARKFASQGQLKSFLLALRLAQFEILRKEKGRSPLLLLDDIFDKLDERRVRQLIGLLLERDFGQIFITDTQRTRIEGILQSVAEGYRVFEVENGRVV